MRSEKTLSVLMPCLSEVSSPSLSHLLCIDDIRVIPQSEFPLEKHNVGIIKAKDECPFTTTHQG